MPQPWQISSIDKGWMAKYITYLIYNNNNNNNELHMHKIWYIAYYVTFFTYNMYEMKMKLMANV